MEFDFSIGEYGNEESTTGCGISPWVTSSISLGRKLRTGPQLILDILSNS